MRTAKLGVAGILLALVAGSAFAQSGRAQQAALPDSAASGTCISVGNAGSADGASAIHGLDITNLDRSANPCADFYEFADGGWLKKKDNEIPAAYPSWGSFNKLADSNQEVLRGILEAASKNDKATSGSNEQKIGDFYAACMNTDKIDAAGIKSLEPELARIAKIHDLAELQTEAVRLQRQGAGVFFRFSSTQDYKDSSQVTGDASQGGLGLPDRDYYTKDDDKSKALREAYVKHVGKMFELLGDAPETAAAEARAVMAIETHLAQASMTNVERRDPDKTYHKMDREQLKMLTHNFSWDAYLRETGFPGVAAVNVNQPDFFKALDAELAATALTDWKTYLRWHLVHSAAPTLSAKFVDENFDFFGRTLTGAKENLPRWKRCVQNTDRQVGEALGQVYAEKYFTPEAKAHALELVHNLIAALRDDLGTLDWMSPATREEARKKLDAITLKIGYPDKWRDYSTLRIDRASYAENTFRGREFEFHRELDQIGRPVDRTEWGMTPPTVNAYYNPSMNEIVFPAGILQPPFYDAKADDAVNYGGMGAVIGHELTHGFDDEGNKFDGQGNLKDWWTAEDRKNFDARAECVSKQFDSFVVEEGLNQNGKLVLGESIADLGGLTIAYRALEKSLEGKPTPEKIDGFTPEQRFFLSWANVWAANYRPEFARLLVKTNPHPLGRFRASAPLANMPAFTKAFGCSSGDAMARPDAERCRIW
jgi:putative endopeptidase